MVVATPPIEAVASEGFVPIFTGWLTVILAVLLLLTVVLHTPLVMVVMVTVVEPFEDKVDVEKVPELAPIVRVAVLPVAVFAPERLYVTV